MPFHPTLQLDDSLMVAAQMRNQFNGLKTLIDQVPAGPPGPQGPAGPQGPPGEVTLAQLDTAIAGTANNPAGIGPFSGSFSNPPTQAEMEAFAGWAETLRAALVR